MRVLFDQATPVPIRAYLEGHDVRTAAQQGWDTLKNGELLAAAEADGFDVLLTTDKNMPYQQNLAGRKIAVVVLGLQQWPSLRPNVRRVVEAIKAAIPGSYTEVEFPSEPGSSHPEHGS
jgi:predicted nuclease of predicted toxin-antitoxin system